MKNKKQTIVRHLLALNNQQIVRTVDSNLFCECSLLTCIFSRFHKRMDKSCHSLDPIVNCYNNSNYCSSSRRYFLNPNGWLYNTYTLWMTIVWMLCSLVQYEHFIQLEKDYALYLGRRRYYHQAQTFFAFCLHGLYQV